MSNECQDCGLCCLETEMLLSKQDLKLIIDRYPDTLATEDFTRIDDDGYNQLKNINGHCFFFDKFNKLCVIYEFRPQGCKFYPLIYDHEKNECIFDKECPKPHIFYHNKNQLNITCKKIRRYLKNQLRIKI